MRKYVKKIVCFLIVLCAGALGRGYAHVIWDSSGQSYFQIGDKGIIRVSMPGQEEVIWLSWADVQRANGGVAVDFSRFALSDQSDNILLFGEDKRVYHNTSSSCWVYSKPTGRLVQ